MERFISAVRFSLETGNWYSALFLALTMPDICCRLASENNKTNGLKYAAWFNKFVGSKYQHVFPGGFGLMVFMSGDDCYALRCAMLHGGEADVTSQRVKSLVNSFHFTTSTGHCNRVDNLLQVDVSIFCNDICDGVLQWYAGFKDRTDFKEKIDSLIVVHTGDSTTPDGLVKFGASK